jgi:hypothetical protein
MTTNIHKKTLRTMIGAHPELKKLAGLCARQRVKNFAQLGQIAIMNRAAQAPDPGAFLTDLLEKLQAEGAEFDALHEAYETERKVVMDESAPRRQAATNRRFEIAKLVEKLDARVRSSSAQRQVEMKRYRDAGLSVENLAAIKFVYTPEAIAGWQAEIDALKAEAVKLDEFIASGPFYKTELLDGTTLAVAPEALAA